MNKLLKLLLILFVVIGVSFFIKTTPNPKLVKVDDCIRINFQSGVSPIYIVYGLDEWGAFARPFMGDGFTVHVNNINYGQIWYICECPL